MHSLCIIQTKVTLKAISLKLTQKIKLECVNEFKTLEIVNGRKLFKFLLLLALSSKKKKLSAGLLQLCTCYIL